MTLDESASGLRARTGSSTGRLTPFVGRQADLGGVMALLDDEAVRLVTIRGMGGVGKTALALELLARLKDRFENGARFVPLAQLNSVDELLPRLAEALDVQLPPSGDLQQALLDHLCNLHILLVLDNFEHLLEEAVLVREMLLAAPRLKVLVTSREKLSLEAEVLYNLGGLVLPQSDDPQEAPQADAVSLFVQRGRQVRPGFGLNAQNAAAVVKLCRMADGNALGILLAASWVEHFSPAEILEQATGSLDFLARGLRDVESRHSGLRALFDSSFTRLDEREKSVYRKISAFRGGFDLRAAQSVAGADLVSLISLVEKSLLRRDADSGRYELHPLLQQYAREQLESCGELDETRAALTAYYSEFVREREPRMISRLQAPALDEIERDLDNIRQAWGEVVRRRDFASARRMMPGLYAFCDMRSRFIEGEAMFRQAADGLKPEPGALADGAWALALLAWYDMHSYIEHLDSYAEQKAQAQECADQLRAAKDAQGEAAALVLVGAVTAHEGDYQSAIPCYEAAMRVYPALADAFWVDMRIGLTYEAAHEYEAAIRAFEACLKRSRESGERVKQGWSHQNIGDCLRFQGRTGEARGFLEQARALFEEIGTHDGVLWAIYSMSHVAWDEEKREQAQELAEQASGLAHQIHSPSWIRETEQWLGVIAPAAPASGLGDPRLRLARPSGGEAGEGDLRSGSRPGQETRAERDNEAVESLSERELEVLQLLKSELSGPEIAQRLVVSLNTVRFHTKHIYQKLGVSKRLEAIRRAKELGL